MYYLQSSEILFYVSKNSCLHFGLHLTVIEQYQDKKEGLRLQNGAVDAVDANNLNGLIEFAGKGGIKAAKQTGSFCSSMSVNA